MKFAVKLVKKTTIKQHSLLDDIKREVEIMYKLNNDHIIRLHNHFEDDYKVYLLLEYAPGGTLYDLILKEKKLPPIRAAKYFREALEAVKYLHSYNIIHKDLKSDNILIDMNGRTKLADFGFASYDNGGPENNRFCGTPMFFSPEVIEMQ